MKKIKKIEITAIVLIIGLVVSIIVYGQSPAAADVWEYKFDNNTNEKKANELGNQGWELVAIQTNPVSPGITSTVYVFKRKK